MLSGHLLPFLSTLYTHSACSSSRRRAHIFAEASAEPPTPDRRDRLKLHNLQILIEAHTSTRGTGAAKWRRVMMVTRQGKFQCDEEQTKVQASVLLSQQLLYAAPVYLIIVAPGIQ